MQPRWVCVFSVGDLETPSDDILVGARSQAGIMHVDADHARDLNDRPSQVVSREHSLEMVLSHY